MHALTISTTGLNEDWMSQTKHATHRSKDGISTKQYVVNAIHVRLLRYCSEAIDVAHYF